MSEVLIHWGIKGQKWGVRRYQNKDGSLTPAGRKRYGDDEVVERVHDGMSNDHVRARSKPISSMTDRELNDAMVRLQREKQYAQLYSELDAPQKSAGRKFAEKFVSRLGDKAIDSAVNAIGNKVFNPVFNNLLDKGIGTVKDRFGKAKASLKDRNKSDNESEESVIDKIKKVKEKKVEKDTFFDEPEHVKTKAVNDPRFRKPDLDDDGTTVTFEPWKRLGEGKQQSKPSSDYDVDSRTSGESLKLLPSKTTVESTSSSTALTVTERKRDMIDSAERMVDKYVKTNDLDLTNTQKQERAKQIVDEWIMDDDTSVVF